ncbi:MAG: hypothetical protein MMC23_009911 [Stictis urceolatum]|nr:hypothetical protein [Stictis urceolata]
MLSPLSLLAALIPALVSAQDPPPYYGYSEQALTALQSWYNTGTGLWDTTNWWNGANCLTVIADLVLVDGNIADQATTIFSTTYTQAQQANSKLRKKRGDIEGSAALLEARKLEERGNAGFLNYYYDDEGWWALAWIAVYDHEKDQKYLDIATSIFEDMQKGNAANCSFDGATGGGLWWDKGHDQINSISNNLYFSIAAHLANRQADNQTYVDIAQNTLGWLDAAGLKNSSNLYTDGLNLQDCTPNNGGGWSYNQGVNIGGLVELAAATGNNDYITTAEATASSFIDLQNQYSGGILRDNCEPNNCNGDETQFKGIFMRNLAKLWQVNGNDDYKTFITKNADSIWANDNSNNQLGLSYTGPYTAADASTHSSAMDALVAAIVVST